MTSRKARYLLFFLVMLMAIKGCSCGSDSNSIIHHHHHGTATQTATPTSTATALPASACVPSSSLSVLVQGTDVASYVPDGSWSNSTKNVEVVPIEGTGITRATVITPNAVNSCASNSVTGETVCTSNATDVYLINGSTLTSTLTSGAVGTTSFSGGSCATCGVVIDATTNTAFLGLAVTGGAGFQAVDLTAGTLATPITAGTLITEDIAVDPKLKLLLSPNEDNVYQLLDLATGNVFDNAVAGATGEFDSAGEDCTTGIALSTDEGTGNLIVTDLTQAVFTPGTGGANGTWTAPLQIQNFPEFVSLGAGTSGIAIAPNTHVGVVTGEFGGAGVGAIVLPATSGTGTPAVTDWVRADLPALPDGSAFSTGFDPHTVTAYVSPTSSKATAIIANGGPTFLAVVDLEGLLAATRTTGTHIVDPTVDLLATGVVRYIKIFP
jgi:hypothetical protein